MRYAVLLISIVATLSAHASTSEELLLESYRNVSRPDSLTLAIVIPCESKKVIFRDTGETDDFLDYYTYELIDYFPALNYWVVEVFGYEWGEWKVINGISGAVTTTISPPIPSPDGTRLLCHMEDIMAVYIDNGIQIWKIQDDSLYLEFSDLEVPWGPINGEWLDDETIVFEKLIYDYSDNEYKTTPGTIRLNEQGEWVPELPGDWKF